MKKRVFIIGIGALLLLLECVFLPFRYAKPADPRHANAGFHTFAAKSADMNLDLEALILELVGTIGTAGFAIFWTKGMDTLPLGE